MSKAMIANILKANDKEEEEVPQGDTQRGYTIYFGIFARISMRSLTIFQAILSLRLDLVKPKHIQSVVILFFVTVDF